MNWLTQQIRDAAWALEDAGQTYRHFRQTIDEKLTESPITEWELLFWTRGLKRGLIHLNTPWFRLGSGRQTSFGFFVRNENNVTVGFRREAVTQAAVYAALVTHYGFPRRHVRFEWDFLDVCLHDATGQVTLYAETKASDKTLEKLVRALSHEFREGLPTLNLRDDQKPPDSYQKAQHILRTRPSHFWAVSPQRRLAFSVVRRGEGFILEPQSDIPFYRDVDLFHALDLPHAAEEPSLFPGMPSL